MNIATITSVRRVLVRTVLVLGGLFFVALPFLVQPANAVKPADPAPVPPKLAFEDAKVDPHAAAVAGLWHVVPVQKKSIAFEDMPVDPLAAERARLWEIDVSAGCGLTCCAKPQPKS